MALIEFVCPHCSGRFEFENPPAGSQAACPLCHQMLTIPDILPEPSADASDDADTVEPSPSLALDIGEPSPQLPQLTASRPKVSQHRPFVETVSRQQRDRRRQVRTLVWMVGGAALLAIAAAVLSRL